MARRPVVAGLAVIAVITVVIVIGGTRFSREDFLEATRNQQARELDFLGQAIHYGPLAGEPSDAERANIAELAATPGFDEFMRRTLFGMDIVRLEMFGLDGSVLYTTDPGSTRPLAPSHPLVQAARRGNSASALSNDVTITDLAGNVDRRVVMETFGLMFDQPPDSPESGRPMSLLAVQRDVGSRLSNVNRSVLSVAGVFFGGLSAVLLIVSNISDRSRRRLELANRRLRVREAAVRESRERMVRADEAAKRAIAEELHGTVQTKLYAVWMKLGMARDRAGEEEVRDELDRLAEDVDGIREQDIRQLSHRLHPSIIRVSALAGLRSLRDFYEDLVPVELEVTDAASGLEEGGASAIPENVRLAVYRIAELALTNVARHAQASSCTVRWDYDTAAGELVLSVTDDGVGFSTEADGEQAPGAHSLGLVTMGDYADALSGSCAVTSGPGQGTRLEFRLPFSSGPSSSGGKSVDAGAEPGDDHAASARPEFAPGTGS